MCKLEGKGLYFLTLWVTMFKEEGKNGFCVKLLGNLVGAKKWVPKMAASRKLNRMGIFCPKDHPRAECTFLFPLTLQ